MTDAIPAPPSPDIPAPSVPPLPSVFVVVERAILDPLYDVRSRSETARLLNIQGRYDRVAIDITRVSSGTYQFDWFERISEYTKTSVVLSVIQWVQHGKQVTLYGGGISNANAPLWISRFSRGQGPPEIRRMLGQGLCYLLDSQQLAYCGDMFGYVDGNEEPKATEVARALMVHAMKLMGWRVKVEAYMAPGHWASGFPSMSTAFYLKDKAALPAGYNPADHEVLVSNDTDGINRIPEWLGQGRTLYLGSTHVAVDRDLPAYWPATAVPHQIG